MRLDAVMDEVALALAAITGLNVSSHPPGSLTAPAGYVAYPKSIDFDETYGRGTDQFTDLGIVLVVGKAYEQSSRDTVAAWASGDGPQSVKRLAEAWDWTTCDDLTVNSCEFDVVSIANIEYLAAIFVATVVGPGGDQ